jgi:hypothetical protein
LDMELAHKEVRINWVIVTIINFYVCMYAYSYF